MGGKYGQRQILSLKLVLSDYIVLIMQWNSYQASAPNVSYMIIRGPWIAIVNKCVMYLCQGCFQMFSQHKRSTCWYSDYTVDMLPYNCMFCFWLIGKNYWSFSSSLYYKTTSKIEIFTLAWKKSLAMILRYYL